MALIPFYVLYVALCLLAFSVLARQAPCNPGQPRFAWAELRDDALYFLINILLYGSVSLWLIKGGVALIDPARAGAIVKAVNAGWGWAASLPIAVQALLVLIVTDVCQYWLHRVLHGRTLWPFHAVHHASVHVDWTTTWRVHPVNFLIYSAVVGAMVKLMGFSPLTYVVLWPINLLMGALVHANLNWTFGPLKYVIASPVFHRWHHSDDPAVRDKNFAPTFPVLDLMFGTFHMPKGEVPRTYGAEGVPGNIIGQMIYPFAAIAARLRPKNRAEVTAV